MRKIILDKIDSTNTYLKALADSGEKEGLLVIAKEQTSGRGRTGKSFFSPLNTGLYMSFLIRPEFSVKESLYITSATAVAVARAIENTTCKSCDIKWVNDLYLNEKKVAGILTEANIDFEKDQINYVVIGVGVNLKAPKESFPKELRDIAGALDTSVEPEALAEEIVSEFFKIYSSFESHSFYEEYKRRSFLLGREVEVVGREDLSGRVVDIDEEFQLILETENKNRISLSSGEVSVRLTST